MMMFIHMELHYIMGYKKLFSSRMCERLENKMNMLIMKDTVITEQSSNKITNKTMHHDMVIFKIFKRDNLPYNCNMYSIKYERNF